VGEINSYKDLQVWQRAMDIAAACYEATRDFPKAEAYGMTSQIRRAAVSIPASIAEGYGRDSTGNFVSFLKVAQGSLKELETHLMLTVRVGIAQQDEVQGLLQQCDELGRMLRAYIRSIQRSVED